MNFGVDTGFYPLGSCTMKYNPKINEEIANLPGFTGLHPLQPLDTVKGALEVYAAMDKALAIEDSKTYKEYLKRLGEAADKQIGSYTDLLEALHRRHDRPCQPPPSIRSA